MVKKLKRKGGDTVNKISGLSKSKDNWAITNRNIFIEGTTKGEQAK